MLELVIFAALAAVVLFQLYTVLGRRVGRQPEDVAETERPRPASELETRRIEDQPAAPQLRVLAQFTRDLSFENPRAPEDRLGD